MQFFALSLCTDTHWLDLENMDSSFSSLAIEPKTESFYDMFEMFLLIPKLAVKWYEISRSYFLEKKLPSFACRQVETEWWSGGWLQSQSPASY